MTEAEKKWKLAKKNIELLYQIRYIANSGEGGDWYYKVAENSLYDLSHRQVIKGTDVFPGSNIFKDKEVSRSFFSYNPYLDFICSIWNIFDLLYEYAELGLRYEHALLKFAPEEAGGEEMVLYSSRQKFFESLKNIEDVQEVRNG